MTFRLVMMNFESSLSNAKDKSQKSKSKKQKAKVKQQQQHKPITNKKNNNYGTFQSC